MNRLQANLSLLAITLLAGIQYAFLKDVPESASGFSYLFITNLIGFLIALPVLGGQLYRSSPRQILYSALLALLLLGFNLFMLLGSAGLDTTVTSFTVTAYIIFVPFISLLFKKKVSRNQMAGVLIVLLGLALSMGVNGKGFLNIGILYLLVADLCFAVSIVLLEEISAQMNPAVLVMGELFFGSLFSFVGWLVEDGFALVLPGDAAFWRSALFVAFFIRGMYGIVQIYAQRYVGAIQVSLIFSTEIIFTLLLSPLLSILLGSQPEQIDLAKVLGCLVIVSGILVADGTVWKSLREIGGKAVARKKVRNE